jgi:hypothetical protein
VDVAHVVEELEDLWKSDLHSLAMLLLGFLELIYRPSAGEEGNYYWQSSVIDFHRSMLARCLQERRRLLPVLDAHLQEEYAWARGQVMGRRTPPTAEPPEACPWSLDEVMDEHWWPPEAPARLP